MEEKWKAVKRYKINPEKLGEIKYLIACAEGKVIPIEEHEKKVKELEWKILELEEKLSHYLLK